MKAALPEYMKFGAVREMHQKSAAGTAIEASVDDAGKTYFGAHIVDPVAVTKVRAGVYKGFSVGGSVTGRDELNKNLITGIRLVEVSLVDRPANPEAVFTCYKADEAKPDTSPESAINELAKMLNSGAVKAEDLLKFAVSTTAEKAPLPKASTMRKGMYGLSTFSSIISAIAALAMDSDAEAEWEKDSSPVPQQLRDWLSTGVQIFETMTTEETSELVEALKPKEAADIVAPIETVAPVVEKASAAAPPAVLAMAAEPGSLAAGASDDSTSSVVKEAAEDSSDLLKSELSKRDEQITYLCAAVKDLSDQVLKLSAQPLPGKALLKAVAKEHDAPSGTGLTPVEPVPDDPLSLIKAAHARGGTPLRFS